MKKLSFKRIATIAGFIALLGLNLLLCSMLLKELAVARSKEDDVTALKEKSDYYYASFKQLTELNNRKTNQDTLKMCIYLNLDGCEECNDKTLLFLKKNFPAKDICIYVDSTQAGRLAALPTRGLSVKYASNDPFFRTMHPFFFVSLRGSNFLKFMHEGTHPEVTDTYFERVKSYFSN